MVANNVIGHVEDLQDLMEGIRILIGNKGIFIFEVPHLIDLIKKLEFDTIYHEHLSYFSLLPIMNLTNQYGLEIFDVKKQSVHGGTIRVFISQKNSFKVKDSVKHFLDEEHRFGLDNIEIYRNFSVKVAEFKRKLKTELEIIKKKINQYLDMALQQKEMYCLTIVI